MRLTNNLRDKIVTDVLDAVTKKDSEALKKRKHQLALRCYNHVFTAKQRDAMNALPRGWLPEDSCLKFNIGGMNVELMADTPMRIPFIVNANDSSPIGTYRSGCHRLGDISDEKIKQAFLDYHADSEALKKRTREITSQTRALLDNVQTYAQLEKNWPEGKKFYSKYKPVHGESQLPAILVADLNKTLGIGEA